MLKGRPDGLEAVATMLELAPTWTVAGFAEQAIVGGAGVGGTGVGGTGVGGTGAGGTGAGGTGVGGTGAGGTAGPTTRDMFAELVAVSLSPE